MGDQIKPLAENLKGCPWQLRQINLWDNQITDTAMLYFAAAFAQYRGLEYLGLGRNHLTDAGLEMLCECFHKTILDDAGAKAKQEELIALEKEKEKAKAKAKAVPKAKAKDQPEEGTGD